jgi:NAD-dependent DNA ligase
MVTGRQTDLLRSIERLRGIAADGRVNTAEVEHLRNWLDMHANLATVHPFSEVGQLVERVLSDGRVDELEEAEFLDVCASFTQTTERLLADQTTDTRYLHGFLEGIASDGVLRPVELDALRSWARERDVCRGTWLFADLLELVDRVLADGRVDPLEQTEMMTFCRDYMEIEPAERAEPDETVLGPEPWFKSDAPVVQSVQGICDWQRGLTFSAHSFCFTGQMRAGKRRDMHVLVEALGGVPANSVTLDLDYLVIGANSNPCCAYASYGRKIEKVMQYRTRGAHTLILHEDRFMGAVSEVT